MQATSTLSVASLNPEYKKVAQEEKLRAAASEMEAGFLSEMLKYTGISENKSDFSGGVGESQFSSFLRDEYAKSIEETNKLGISKNIFDSMVKRGL
ncbi:flagellar biosynthesis protein FlgJ [Rhodobacteraceae bacterium]|nr:flagellar biosynthesis protein FlgJ [Paracoccaceae bacterium]